MLRSCRNSSANRGDAFCQRAPDVGGTDLDKKAQQEFYRKFLDKQVRERCERGRRAGSVGEAGSGSNTLSVVGLAAEGKWQLNKYRREIDPEEQEKLKKQCQIMKSELMKQIEEKNEKRVKEKQMRKEEEEREEERIKKEQAELARKRELEEQLLKNKISKYAHQSNRGAVLDKSFASVNRQPQPELKPASSESSLRLVGTAIVSPAAYPPADFALRPQPGVSARHSATPTADVHRISTGSSASQQRCSVATASSGVRAEADLLVQNDVLDSAINPLKYPLQDKNVVVANVETAKLIEEYQRQIELLKSQNQMAKEAALIYKEQLLRELDIKMQAMRLQSIAPLQAGEHSLKESTNFISGYGARAEPNFAFEESLCSSTKQVPGVDLKNINEEKIKEMERSLCSETKFVAIADPTDAELYKTWRLSEVRKNDAPVNQSISRESTVNVSFLLLSRRRKMG